MFNVWKNHGAVAPPLDSVGSLMGICAHAWSFEWPAINLTKNVNHLGNVGTYPYAIAFDFSGI